MTQPVVHGAMPRVAVASACILGEGPVWDHRTGTLLWVDIYGPAIWRYEPASGHSARIEVPEPVGFVALTPDPEVVIAGFRSGLARFSLADGSVETLAAPEPEKPGNRINDGHVGPDGMLYFATMDDREREPSGAFFRFDGRDLSRFHAGLCIANGPAVSPDGRTLYTVDTQKRVVQSHEIGPDGPGKPRPFTRFDKSAGYPDGIAVDADGHVWVCHFGGSRITRFTPEGAPERVLPVPTANVTKCAFGGPDLETIYITTAAKGRDPTVDLMAGHLFAVSSEGIRGLPAMIFSGERAP